MSVDVELGSRQNKHLKNTVAAKKNATFANISAMEDRIFMKFET